MDVTAAKMIMVPAPAVWVGIAFMVGPLVYGVIWAFKDTARWIGRERFGWKADPKWNGPLRFASIILGAVAGWLAFHWLQPQDWPWGVGIGGLAGLFNIAIYGLLKRQGLKRAASMIIGMEARRAEDTLDEREDAA